MTRNRNLPTTLVLITTIAGGVVACSGEVGGHPADKNGAPATPAAAIGTAPNGASSADAATPIPSTSTSTDAGLALSNVADAQTSGLREACKAEALNYCTQLSLKASDVFEFAFLDLQQCLNDVFERCVSIVEADGSNWTEQSELACANAWPDAPVNDFMWSTPAACYSPPGKKADGAACAFGTECASRGCIVRPGEACGFCRARSVFGEPCNTTAECADDWACLDGKCGAMPKLEPVGTPCASDAQCGYFRYCKGTYVWNATSSTWSFTGGTCAPFTTVAAGAACGTFFGPGTTSVPIVDVKACDFGTCTYPSPDSSVGTCHALPALGQPCTLIVGCAKGACIGGTCKLPDPAGCK